jgi:hypothetical protein
MNFSLFFRQILNYVLWTLAAVISVYFIYIDAVETIKRIEGSNTLLSQMSWLTDRQAIIYSGALALTFIALLTFLGHQVYRNNKRGATIISLVTLVMALITLFAETFLYYKTV